jgi:hypothetical protein
MTDIGHRSVFRFIRISVDDRLSVVVSSCSHLPHAGSNERFVWHALTNGKGVVDRRSATPFAKPQGRATPT